MDPLKSTGIQGNWATLLLPIQADDSIDGGCLAQEIDRLISFGVDGIYSNSTAGEFYNQTEDEFDMISRLLAERCNRANMPFQIGVSHMSPVISLARLKRVVALKPGAVQVILPDWFPVTNEEAVSFLQTLAEHAEGIGLVLYNPPHAKRRLLPQDFAAIKRAVPSLDGLKVAGGDSGWFAEMRRLLPDVSVFVPGHTLASGFRLGAQGAYSNVACLNPAAAQRWYDQMRSDIAAALKLETRIRRFFDECMLQYIVDAGYSNQAVDKLLACIGEWTCLSPRLRWPYRSIPAAEAKRQRVKAQAWLPEFFCA